MEELELWGGIECTVNRVHGVYLNQLERSGHCARIEDLDRIAELGIRTLRYPALWELAAPANPNEIDWRWADERLTRLRNLGIAPIAGLVHHGSGPAYTSLIDDGFAEGLGDYAARFAARFPWVEWYTPVNEPLTTARFSGLYGLWYPHGRDDCTFLRALINECKASVLAMERIRAINPHAKLLQTEDLGTTYSTSVLRYQADFNNHRRWLTWDLLCGSVDRHHPMYRYLLDSGVSAAELSWFRAHQCPPDLIGINHYITSDRFLDHRLERYPAATSGGSGPARYADVDAVRVISRPTAPWHDALTTAWERYRIPLALTEVHLGCTREEQMRWLLHAWQSAHRARSAGCHVRAVTAWALLGSYDWDSLVTRQEGHYEPGAFDGTGGALRPTALAGLIRSLAYGERVEHPCLSSPGWWRRPLRLSYERVRVEPATARHQKRRAQRPEHAKLAAASRCRAPILVTGATGTLGQAFRRICEERGLRHRLCTRAELDISDTRAIESALESIQPWAVINAAGYARVDDAEGDSERCFRENSVGPGELAVACARRELPLLTFSSDMVFDGHTDSPYIERTQVAPLNVYGRSKAAAEVAVLKGHPGALVIRSSSFFGIWDRHNFVHCALRALARGEPFMAMEDVVVSPTFVPDLAHACLDLLIDREHGIWHLANRGQTSCADLARHAARLLGINTQSLQPRSSQSLQLAAARPAYSVLGTERGLILPPLEHALERFARQARVPDFAVS